MSAPPSAPRSFQEIILRLQSYWASKGCAILQPYDMEVGAGTFHPATTLRSLGTKPWAAAYVQPSRRPTDGRYGENPNRLQHYYQYQVLIKPSPPDLQDLYLGSLEAIGIDMALHDIRFVEDDWESPTLGAWGLGWEVWCDGMEVSQFTYFQQVGGHDCRPVSGELTYGTQALLTKIVELLPSPAEVAPPAEAPLLGRVFKTMSEPHVGDVSFFRIYRGTIRNGSEVYNAEHEVTEKLNHLSIQQGKERFEVPELQAGDIGSVAKLRDTHTNDTFCLAEHPVYLDPIPFPNAVATSAVMVVFADGYPSLPSIIESPSPSMDRPSSSSRSRSG